MTTPMPPRGNNERPGLRPLQDAADSFARATQRITDTQSKQTAQIGQLAKVLTNLQQVLTKGRSGVTGEAALGTTGSHGYGQIGGNATFGGVPHDQARQSHRTGQQPQPHAQTHPHQQHAQVKTPNGGGGVFSGLVQSVTWTGRTPSPTAPGGFRRFMAGMSGDTPKAWNTKYGGWETSASLTSQGIGAAAQRGMDQLDDASIYQISMMEERQFGRGLSQDQLDERGLMGLLGTRSRNAETLDQTMRIGQGARASIQSAQDAYETSRIEQRISGGSVSEASWRRRQSLRSAADAFAYANPTLSASAATQFASGMFRPSNRMRMVLMGLPDPIGPDGTYKGNKRFFEAFMKRMYQGRDHVPSHVFNDEFREGGIGWANLVYVVGEEGAEIMLPILRAYNDAKARGEDVSDLDTLMSQANTTGKAGDAARATLERKYNLGRADLAVQRHQRMNAESRASEAAGNEDYLEAEKAATAAMHKFAEAVHKFVNAPFISDIATWLKGTGPSLKQAQDWATGIFGGLSGLGSLGSVFANGGGRAVGQAAAAESLGGGSSGAAHVPSPRAMGTLLEKTEKKTENLGEAIARKAKSYATGSRKYKYSQALRWKPGYFDCSSFVATVYKQFGFTVGPTTLQMWKQGKPVSLDEVEPGDILLWAKGTPGRVGGSAEHTEIYIGNGKTVGTARAGPGQNTIQIQPFRKSEWDAARRIVGNVKPGKKQKDTSNAETEGEGGWFNKLTDKVGEAVSSLGKAVVGGLGGAFSTAGTNLVGGLGAPNASAYSTSELEALMGILSGGGGGGGILFRPGAEGAESSEESSDEPPSEARGTEQDPDGADAEIGGNLLERVKKSMVSNVSKATRRDAQARKRSDKTVQESIAAGFGGSRWTQNFAPAKHPPSNPEANKAVARRLLKQYGWEKHWPALEKLWNRESSWNHYADNPTSDAYGIAQALPPWKMSSAGADWRTNPITQIKWGLQYIKQRYGDPSKAWAFHQEHGWYDKGAWQVPDDQVAVVHKDEMIIPAQQAETIRDAILREVGSNKVTGGERGSEISTLKEKPNVQLNFAAGSVVLQFGSNVSPKVGSQAARAFLKELEKRELYESIAHGGGGLIRARA